MLSLFRKHALVISILLFLVLLGLVWLFPSFEFIFTMLFLVCGFILASLPVMVKHRQTYLQGKISRGVYTRNILLDAAGILLALVMAALLGWYIAGIAMKQISHDLIKLIAGIMIGLSIGLAVGTFINQAWGRFVTTSPEN